MKLQQLPIDQCLPQLLTAVSHHPSIILHAPPGAGKTTRVPLALLSHLPVDAGRIIMLEPRRIAAVAAARWMAACLEEEVGQTIGYSIRFERQVSALTRVEVMTEGILTRRVQRDPLLEGVAMVIFDEFHERSIHADLGLALCREVQQGLRLDLKLLVMSATLAVEPLSRLLGNAPIISAAGRSYPVKEVYWEQQPHAPLPRRMAAAIVEAVREREGDILAFLPGVGEIRACAGLLAELTGSREDLEICPLYGDLPVAHQQRIIQPGPRRKIVLATDIAETSLTIDGVRIIIDSGLSRRMRHDPATGMNRLVTVRESQSSAEQRKGRGGRTGPGVCYRLFGRYTFMAMLEYSPPEITEADLTPLLLELAAWGVVDPGSLPWLDTPPEAAVSVARQLLQVLELMDETGRITSLGRTVVEIPLHPRLARLLVCAAEWGSPRFGATLAALMAERDPFRNRQDLQHLPMAVSDVEERLEWLEHQPDPAIERISRQLVRMIPGVPVHRELPWDHQLCSRLLLKAWPDRIAQRRGDGTDRYLLVTGRGARLSPRSCVRQAEYLLAISLDGGTGAEGMIHLASGLDVSILRQECANRIEMTTECGWDTVQGRVVSQRQERLGHLVLSSTAYQSSSEETIPVVISAVRTSGLGLLSLEQSFRQLQGRIDLVRRLFPGDGWPDLSEQALMDTLEEWLTPRLTGVRTARQLAELDIVQILMERIEYRQQRDLDELAPLLLAVPSGSRIRLDYTSGEIPVLAVKLQELFGLAHTPVIAKGRAPVLLHLLSPAGRPLQVTTDLAGFWNSSYHEVKKEMKGRYPKHPWPDDPWSAIPTRKTKPRV